MGTSTSQHSPTTTNWAPVRAVYENKSIPEERTINEIWRAGENEKSPMSDNLKHQAIYDCYNAVNSSGSFQEALQKFSNVIAENKSNSIVAELAKRAIPGAFQSPNAIQNWTGQLFAEVTNYIVSRDTSGFVGSQYRNKSVQELINFKNAISNKVSDIIKAEKSSIKTLKDWNTFIDKSIMKLKTHK
jgi:hypothetical protein